MLDLPVFMKQHAQIGEGLAAFETLPSHLPGATMMATTKDHNFCFWDADGEAIGRTERLHGVQQLLQPLRGCGEQRNVMSQKEARYLGGPIFRVIYRCLMPICDIHPFSKPATGTTNPADPVQFSLVGADPVGRLGSMKRFR